MNRYAARFVPLTNVAQRVVRVTAVGILLVTSAGESCGFVAVTMGYRCVTGSVDAGGVAGDGAQRHRVPPAALHCIAEGVNGACVESLGQTRAAMTAATRSADYPGIPAGTAEPLADYRMRVLRWTDERNAAAVLGRAFVDDPLVIAICNTHVADREERMRWGFRVAIRSHCLMTQPAWTMTDRGGRVVGVVLVTRPRTTLPSYVDPVFAFWGLLHIGLRVGRRGATAARLIAEQAPREPFTYLRTLGVEPELHGCGVGSRLVERVICTAPAGVPIYLETAKERNLDFYARHGFHCVGEFRCLGVPMWRLLRPARE
jgi:GNAT superfamily N-acetyltransferase